MNYMFTVAEQRSYYQSKLQQADNELERLLRKYEGLDNVRLRVQKHGKGYQYFLVKRRAEKEESAAEKKKRRRGSYIRKRQLKTAHVLAQRDYLLSVQENCRQWLAYCDVVSGLTVPASLSELHLKNSGRYGLISPIVLSDSEFLKSWSEKPYQGKSFKPDTPFQVTERGEKVRSKSEKIIADFLNAHHIPYKYECPLALTHSGSGKVILYPDFTLMDIRTRKELYSHCRIFSIFAYLCSFSIEHSPLFRYDEPIFWRFKMEYHREGQCLEPATCCRTPGQSVLPFLFWSFSCLHL